MPITRQEAGHAANAHGEPGCFRDTGGTGVLPHRPRAWGAGSSADTRTRTTLVTIPAHSGTTQTESVTGRVGIPGPRGGTGPGCWLSRGVAQRKACRSFTPFSGQTLSEHRYVHYPQAQWGLAGGSPGLCLQA